MISAAGMSTEGFNRLYPVGTPVTAFTFGRDHALRTRTSTPAWNIGIGDPVVSVEGRVGHLALEKIFINPSENYTEGTEQLVTQETVEKISRWLDSMGVFAKGYNRSSSHQVETIGLRIGERPDHVVALWGDTLVQRPDGTFTVRRIIPPAVSNPVLFFRELTEAEAAEDLGERLAQAVEESRCCCKDPKPDQYTLAIDCGSIEITHTPCGKRPWFMFDDWTDVVCTGQDIPVRIEQITGCSGYPCFTESCDCGPEVTLTPRKDTSS